MSRRRLALRCSALVALMTFASVVEARGDAAQEDFLSGRVSFEQVDGVYVNLGRRARLSEGQVGFLRQDGRRVARVVVEAVKLDSSFLRITALRPGEQRPARGTTVQLEFDPLPEGEKPAPPAARAGDARGAERPSPRDEAPESAIGEARPDDDPAAAPPGLDEDLTPLLAPSTSGVTATRNVFHGLFGLRQFSQWTSDAHLDAHRTGIRSAGSVDRIAGTPWSMVWRADLSTRFGDGYEDVRDFEEPRVDLYEWAFSRRYEDDSTLQFGRFVPRALPSIGRVDAVQAERVIDRRFRVGAVLGTRSERKDGNLRFAEPLAAPYLSFFHRAQDGDEYSATGGLLLSGFEGELDRVAVLVDQFLTRGSMTVFSSTEVDLDSGNAEFHDDPLRLTRQDLSVQWNRAGLQPRFGVVYDERPDIEAERDLIDDLILDEADFFDQDGFTRLWAGLRMPLGRGFDLDLQGGYDFSEALDTEHWRVRLGKRGLWGSANARADWSVYRLVGVGQEGVGSRLAATFPTARSRLLWMPSLVFRLIDDEVSSGTLEMSEIGLQVFYRPAGRWSLGMSGAFVNTEGVQGVRAQLSWDWRF